MEVRAQGLIEVLGWKLKGGIESITGVFVEIRTKHLPNTIPEYYYNTSSMGSKASILFSWLLCAYNCSGTVQPIENWLMVIKHSYVLYIRSKL
jgi:hypothetical protein